MKPQNTNSKPSTNTPLGHLDKIELLCRHISRVICLTVFLFSLTVLQVIYAVNVNQQTAQAAQVSELLPDNERTPLKGIEPFGAATSDATQPGFWSDKQLTIFFPVAALSSVFLLLAPDKSHEASFENKEEQSEGHQSEEQPEGANLKEDARGER